MFLEKVINLRIIKKSAYLGKIHQDPPPNSRPASLPQIRHFFLKFTTFSTNPGFFLKTRGPGPKVATGGWGGDGFGHHLVPILFGFILELFANFEA
jgi:hypothetical protein